MPSGGIICTAHGLASGYSNDTSTFSQHCFTTSSGQQGVLSQPTFPLAYSLHPVRCANSEWHRWTHGCCVTRSESIAQPTSRAQ